jgi:soluble lytic murein transglycosylase
MVEFIKRFKWWLFGIIFLGAVVLCFDRFRTYREHSQDAVILAAGAKHGVHPALIKAVVWRESWFNPRAKGRSGEVGLMQIMAATGSDWATAERVRVFVHDRLYDPRMNTECGAWYLRRLLNRYARTDNPLPYTLAAYNAGPGNVAKWATGAAATNSALFIGQIGFPKTRDYVTTVMKRFERYAKVFPPRKDGARAGGSVAGEGREATVKFGAERFAFLLGGLTRDGERFADRVSHATEREGNLEAIPVVERDLPLDMIAGRQDGPAGNARERDDTCLGNVTGAARPIGGYGDVAALGG